MVGIVGKVLFLRFFIELLYNMSWRKTVLTSILYIVVFCGPELFFNIDSTCFVNALLFSPRRLIGGG